MPGIEDFDRPTRSGEHIGLEAVPVIFRQGIDVASTVSCQAEIDAANARAGDAGETALRERQEGEKVALTAQNH